MQKGDYELRKYHCRYCGKKFERLVVQKQMYGEVGNETYSITSQVKCRECGNFLKT